MDVICENIENWPYAHFRLWFWNYTFYSSYCPLRQQKDTLSCKVPISESKER